jgi:hypothetical protein
MLVELELTAFQSAMTRFLVIGRNRSRVWIDYIDFSATGTLEASERLNNVLQGIKLALKETAIHDSPYGIIRYFGRSDQQARPGSRKISSHGSMICQLENTPLLPGSLAETSPGWELRAKRSLKIENLHSR